MLAKRIIPCLDVDAGRVVKGVKFVDIRDAGDPVEVARRYNEEGADEITFLDITASHENRRTLFDLVDRTASTVAVPLTVGGGVRERRDVSELLHAGADKVSINSAAVHNPDLITAGATQFGSQCTEGIGGGTGHGLGLGQTFRGGRDLRIKEVESQFSETNDLGAVLGGFPDGCQAACAVFLPVVAGVLLDEGNFHGDSSGNPSGV